MSKNQIQKEIVDSLPSLCHGLLNLAPRVGKTKIGIDIIKKEKPKKILWVTPSAKLRDEDIPAEFKQWKALGYLKKTDIICYASLSGHVGKYDKIVLDEYQDATILNMEVFFNGNIEYKTILGLSGTHPTHKEKQEIYDKLNLKILSKMGIDEAVDKGLIAPYTIEVIECKLDDKNKYISAGNTTTRFMQTEKDRYKYLTQQINSKLFAKQAVPSFFFLNRMRFLYNLKSKNDFAKKFVAGLKGRTLVFTGGIAEAESICENTYHSKTTDAKLVSFLNKEIDTLACVNVGGVGFTYRGVDNFVIVQVNSNQKGDATQKIARSLVYQKGYVAKIYILCVVDTVDESWKEKVLKDLNPMNIKHVSYRNYEEY